MTTSPIPPPMDTDDEVVSVQLPAALVDDLTVATIRLSLQLGHRIPVLTLRAALVRCGLAHPTTL